MGDREAGWGLFSAFVVHCLNPFNSLNGCRVPSRMEEGKGSEVIHYVMQANELRIDCFKIEWAGS